MFELLGITPIRCPPEVVVSRHHGLVGNVTQEIGNARAVATLGANAIGELNYDIGYRDVEAGFTYQTQTARASSSV